MRFRFALPGLFLLSSVVQAQTPQYVNSAQGDYEYKQGLARNANGQLESAKVDLWKAVDEAQRRWVDVRPDEREQWLGRYKIYENVISLRKKDKVMEWVDEQRKKLGVSELDGYRRLGIHNPYTDESYIRYYDDKTSELKVSEMRGTEADLKRQREDLEKRREFYAESYQDAWKKYDQASKAYDAAVKAGKDLAAAAEAREKAFQRWATEERTRGWEEDLELYPFTEEGRQQALRDSRSGTGGGAAAGSGPYHVNVRGSQSYLNTSTPYPDRDRALRSAREGWDVWRNRGDIYGVTVTDSNGNVILRLGR